MYSKKQWDVRKGDAAPGRPLRIMGKRGLRQVLLGAAVLVLLIAAAGCSGQEGASTAAGSSAEGSAQSTQGGVVRVEDYAGVEVFVSSADRIVSLSPATTGVLIELGVEDRIVGTDEASRGAQNAVQCGTADNPDVDKIVSLDPDIVFVGPAAPDSALSELQGAGLSVVDAQAATLPEVPGSFAFVGTIVGETAAGEALAEQFDDTMAEVADAQPDTAPRCLYVASFSDGRTRTSGPGSLVSAMLEAAGAEMVTADAGSEWIEYTAQQVEVASPQMIVYASSAVTYEELTESTVYAGLDAVQGGLVFGIEEDLVTVPGPSVNEGLLALSSIVNEAAQGPVSDLEASDAPQEVTD